MGSARHHHLSYSKVFQKEEEDDEGAREEREKKRYLTTLNPKDESTTGRIAKRAAKYRTSSGRIPLGRQELAVRPPVLLPRLKRPTKRR